MRRLLDTAVQGAGGGSSPHGLEHAGAAGAASAGEGCRPPREDRIRAAARTLTTLAIAFASSVVLTLAG